jgi:hypothetical protein
MLMEEQDDDRSHSDRIFSTVGSARLLGSAEQSEVGTGKLLFTPWKALAPPRPRRIIQNQIEPTSISAGGVTF